MHNITLSGAGLPTDCQDGKRDENSRRNTMKSRKSKSSRRNQKENVNTQFNTNIAASLEKLPERNTTSAKMDTTEISRTSFQ